MVKRHGTKQTAQMEHLKSTYLVRENVSNLDLAIIQKSSNFPKKTKKDRHYNNGVKHAKQDLKLLRFFLYHLKPKYRMKILNSVEFNNFLEVILDVQIDVKLETKEERDRGLIIALQMYEYSRFVIKRNMPKEFQNVLEEASRPFWRMIKAIDAYQKREKIKDSPNIQITYLASVESE